MRAEHFSLRPATLRLAGGESEDHATGVGCLYDFEIKTTAFLKTVPKEFCYLSLRNMVTTWPAIFFGAKYLPQVANLIVLSSKT